MTGLRRVAAGLACLALAGATAAATSSPAAPLSVQLAAGNAETSSALRVFLALTALSFIPAALVCMSSFVRIIVVLSMLRHAVGLTETPPNMVLVSLALFLTLFSMSPVLDQVDGSAVQPYLAGRLTPMEAIERGKAPLRDFMIRQTRERDLMLMVDVAHARRPATPADIGFVHLVPAFMLSELRAAFQVGFVIYLPFLLVDLVVASVLMALGMMMVPPTTVSIPMKILLFVLIDGWNVVVKALLGTFH